MHEAGPTFADTFPYWPNFILYLVALYFLTRKPFREFWKSRKEGIATQVQRAVSRKIEAQEKLKAIQRKLSNLETEVRAIQDQITSDAHTEADQIVKSGEASAKKIGERAQETAAREIRSAVAQVQREMAESALSEAEKRLKALKSPSLHEKLLHLGVNGATQLIH